MDDSDRIEATLQQGISAVKAGRIEEGRSLLKRVTFADQRNEKAWLWLAATTNNPQEQRQYLETVIKINPNNETAAWEISKLPKRVNPSPKDQGLRSYLSDEGLPNIPMPYALGILGAVAVIMLIIVLSFVGSSNNNDEIQSPTQPTAKSPQDDPTPQYAFDFTGTGGSVESVRLESRGTGLFGGGHAGSGFFVVRVTDLTSGRVIGMPLMCQGNCNDEGTLSLDPGMYLFDVDADGEWFIVFTLLPSSRSP